MSQCCTKQKAYKAFKYFIALFDLLSEAVCDAGAAAAEISKLWEIIGAIFILSLIANSPSAFYDLKKMQSRSDGARAEESKTCEQDESETAEQTKCQYCCEGFWQVLRTSFSILVFCAYGYIVYTGAQTDYGESPLVANASSDWSPTPWGAMSNTTRNALSGLTAVPWTVFEGTASFPVYAGQHFMRSITKKIALRWGCWSNAQRRYNPFAEPGMTVEKLAAQKVGKCYSQIISGVFGPFFLLMCFQAWNLLDIFCKLLASLCMDPGFALKLLRTVSFLIAFPGLLIHFADYNLKEEVRNWIPNFVTTWPVRIISIICASFFYFSYEFNRDIHFLNDAFGVATPAGSLNFYLTLGYAVLAGGGRSLARNLIFSRESPHTPNERPWTSIFRCCVNGKRPAKPRLSSITLRTALLEP